MNDIVTALVCLALGWILGQVVLAGGPSAAIDRAIDALRLLADPAMNYTPAGAWRMAGTLQRRAHR